MDKPDYKGASEDFIQRHEFYARRDAMLDDGKPKPQYNANDELQMGYGSGMAAGAAWPGPVIAQNGQLVVIDLNSKSQPFLMGYSAGFSEGHRAAISQDHAARSAYWDRVDAFKEQFKNRGKGRGR